LVEPSTSCAMSRTPAAVALGSSFIRRQASFRTVPEA
jgi:hypothetical protein